MNDDQFTELKKCLDGRFADQQEKLESHLNQQPAKSAGQLLCHVGSEVREGCA
jgi:hypothetical protein